MQTFLSKTLEIFGALVLLYCFWIIDLFLPLIAAITFFVVGLSIWDHFRNKENDINTNYDDQL